MTVDAAMQGIHMIRIASLLLICACIGEAPAFAQG